MDIVAFDELDLGTLHDLLALRAEVFVVEQDCVYQDIDGKDPRSFHLFRYKADRLEGTLRILPKGIGYSDAVAIGRVVTSPASRGKGIGHLMMKAAVDFIAIHYPGESIKLSAQTHLSAFYEAHGFSICGEGYLEDGIPHVPMICIPD